MEITWQCRIKGKIKESVSNWSVTAVCSASQLEVLREKRQRWSSAPWASSLSLQIFGAWLFVLLTQTGCGGWQVLFTPTDLCQWNEWCYYCQRSARGNNEMDGLSSYYRTEEGTFHCLPACIFACLHTHVLIQCLQSVCLSFVSVSEWQNKARQNCNMTVNQWLVPFQTNVIIFPYLLIKHFVGNSLSHNRGGSNMSNVTSKSQVGVVRIKQVKLSHKKSIESSRCSGQVSHKSN